MGGVGGDACQRIVGIDEAPVFGWRAVIGVGVVRLRGSARVEV